MTYPLQLLVGRYAFTVYIISHLEYDICKVIEPLLVLPNFIIQCPLCDENIYAVYQ